MSDRAVPDLFRLDGKVAVVTGASSGLGVAFAEGLAQAGADVVLGARRVDRLAETAALVEATGRRALTHGTDVADPQSCTDLVAVAMEELGRVDVLVNNAGVGTAVPATRETPEQFRGVIDVNLNGCYWMAQACGRQWTGRKGIRVNAIAPGFFDSEMTEQYPPGYLDQMGARIPSGRKGDPAELAATVVFLASDAAGYITGQTLAVDGGMTIT
jgi:NAD(P)-dependent dehydrogenase (short-subunit alcohol dehydrogenase family)